MKLDVGSLTAILCAAKEKMRYGLTGLHITKSETVATDGRKLVVVKHPEQPEDGDAQDLERPRLLDREAVLQALKGLSKKVRDPDHLKQIEVDVAATNGSGKVHADVPVSGGRATVELPEIAGTFPNWEGVVPSEKNFTVGVCLNGTYLTEVLKVITATNKARGREMNPNSIVLKLTLPGDWSHEGKFVTGPVRVESSRGDVYAVLPFGEPTDETVRGDAYGVVMPISRE